MVLGIQNYFCVATCISIDCRDIHRRVMTVLKNRLNSEKGCRLVREGGTLTQSEKERFGNSKMIRYVAGIEQPIYPIAFIKHKIPMAKRNAVNSYTVKGRALIHTNLNLNHKILDDISKQKSGGHSMEYMDCRLSLFSAQQGKCSICGEEFTTSEEIETWLKKPAEKGGMERYQNMILIHKRYVSLLVATSPEELKTISKSLKINKKILEKVNNLRKQAWLPAIE